MKKYLLLLLFTATAFAQTPVASNELVAQGMAKIKVQPDVVTLKTDVRKRHEDEGEALKALNIEVTAVKQFLLKSGVPDKAIKITDYSINSTDRNNGNSEDKKVYNATASLSVEIKLDNKLLDMVYTELQSGKYKDVTVNYTTSLSDELQKASNASLIEKAIVDARANADNMARVLGVKINGVKRISKSESDQRFYRGYDKSYEYVSRSPRYLGATILGDSELGEKELEDQVIIVYEISK